MTRAVLLFNSVAYSAALVGFAAARLRVRPLNACACFILVTAAQCLLGTAYLTMLASVVIAALCLYQEHRFFQTVYACFSSMMLLFAIVSVVSSVVRLTAPAFMESLAYDFITGGILTGASLLVWRVSKRFPRRAHTKKTALYSLLVQITVFCFYVFILPGFVPDPRGFALVLLSYVAFLAVCNVLLSLLKRAEWESKLANMKRAHEREIKRQYQTVVAYKHYYHRLYMVLEQYVRSRDMKGMARHFDQFITPSHLALHEEKRLDNLQNKLIRDLMQCVIDQVYELPDVRLYLQITGTIQIARRQELDIFKVLNEWIDNALEALRGQKNGVLQIAFTGMGSEVHIAVSNTLKGDTEPDLNGGQGHGLELCGQILYNSMNIESGRFTEYSPEADRLVFTQLMMIERGGAG